MGPACTLLPVRAGLRLGFWRMQRGLYCPDKRKAKTFSVCLPSQVLPTGAHLSEAYTAHCHPYANQHNLHDIEHVMHVYCLHLASLPSLHASSPDSREWFRHLCYRASPRTCAHHQPITN